MSQIKINRAAKLAQAGKYPRTWSEIIAKIPSDVIKSGTSKQLADLADAMHAQYDAGHTAGYKEAPVAAQGGRPAELKDGKRVNVYLDAGSLKLAAELGGGNVSEGIRIALSSVTN